MPAENELRLPLAISLGALVLAWVRAQRSVLAALVRPRRTERIRSGRRQEKHLLSLPPPAYGGASGRALLAPGARGSMIAPAAPGGDSELHELLVGRRLGTDLQRAYDDYLRLHAALLWLRDLDPLNEVAIAMVGGDAGRARTRLLRLLRESA